MKSHEVSTSSPISDTEAYEIYQNLQHVLWEPSELVVRDVSENPVQIRTFDTETDTHVVLRSARELLDAEINNITRLPAVNFRGMAVPLLTVERAPAPRLYFTAGYGSRRSMYINYDPTKVYARPGISVIDVHAPNYGGCSAEYSDEKKIAFKKLVSRLLNQLIS